jgi:heme-degrading monooxygenase HmoA
VIARVWSARASPEDAPRYAAYLEAHVFPELRAIDGYRSAMLLQRHNEADVEVQVVTWWHSLQAIRAFSGPDLEAAVVTNVAAGMLLQYDHRVRHFEVVATDGA